MHFFLTNYILNFAKKNKTQTIDEEKTKRIQNMKIKN